MTIEFAYAQARAQARLGVRLTPAAWQTLEASGTLAQYLHAARATDLRSRVQALTAVSSPYAIERSLRRDWRAEVYRTARWVPARWQPAFAWTVWLSDLPAFAWLEQTGEPLPWMGDDKQLARFATKDGELRRHELDEAGLRALAGRDDVLAAWRQRFEALWPAGDEDVRRLGEFVALVDDYRRAPIQGYRARKALGQLLEARVVRLIRRSLREPVTVFAHLLLVALDLGRLRDGLVRRALFGDWLAAA